ncbi:MAG TPA: PPOX class F420-dependent oxidoreductase [Nocardioides sp.]|uniref:PPOX class F420-dependent oxidoreductase n=1 Tax=Nocardioides sp. TaxID=35761 RepID=UPI002F425C81
MELDEAIATARATHQSVLTTIRSDGRPQLSNVLHYVRDDGLIVVSTTADTAKYHNLRRQPWAALKVDGSSFWSYAVLEAEATFSDVAGDPHDPAVEELVDYFRAVSGEHSDWDEYRQAMVSEGRVAVRLTPTRAYGLLR